MISHTPQQIDLFFPLKCSKDMKGIMLSDYSQCFPGPGLRKGFLCASEKFGVIRIVRQNKKEAGDFVLGAESAYCAKVFRETVGRDSGGDPIQIHRARDPGITVDYMEKVAVKGEMGGPWIDTSGRLKSYVIYQDYQQSVRKTKEIC